MLKTCIILAAGLGTRMRPLTDNQCKPMIEIMGKPLIFYVIDMCFKAGIEKIIINYHYKPQSLIDYINNNYYNQIILSDETELLLDSGGGVLQASTYTNDEEFFVINADCIWDTMKQTHKNALEQLYNHYDSKKFDVFKLLCSPQKAIGFYGNPIYRLDKDNYIYNNTILEYEFTGIQILKRKLLTNYHVKPFSIREIWKTAFHHNRVGGIEFQGQWLHIGTPQAVIESEIYFKNLSKYIINK
jgi:MurNAc alpha-1-phosphate uridylyltransferase